MKKFVFIFVLFSLTTTYAKNTFYSQISSIPENVQKLMIGKSWHKGCPVGFEQLSYLKLSYWGFDNKPHVGELIVYKGIAEDTVATFKKLYEIKFPIESMKLPERFSGEFYARDNNTSAFYCRSDDQSPKNLSDHSYGIAIDVNSVYNPAVIANNKIWPEEGKKYMDRHLQHKGMFHLGDPAVNILTQHGWYWGAFFPDGVDYQHFQKVMIDHYLITGLQDCRQINN